MAGVVGDHWRVGTCIDNRFTITGCLSHTGAAVVWQGNDLSLSATVTIVQHPRVQHAAMQDARRQEAQSASALTSDIWIPVLGFGEWVGRSYLVAEEIKGDSLEGVLRSAQARGEGLSQRLICSVAMEVLSALESAEAAGVVHGDVCTGCVFMCEGNVRLLSIGMANTASRQATHEVLPHASPEQVMEQPLDITSDLWGLGVMIYRMASGKYPFAPTGRWTMRDAVLLQPTPDLMENAVSRISTSLGWVVSRALERSRERRYQSVADMHKDLLLAMQDARQESAGQVSSRVEQAEPQRPQLTPRTERINLTPAGASVPMLTPRGGVMQTPRGSTVFHAVGDAVLPKTLGLSQLSKAGFQLQPLERDTRIHSHAPPQPAPSPPPPHLLTPRAPPHAASPPHPAATPTEPGTVGLIVTRDPPHKVLEVADMCDANGTVQGLPGYSNPLVLPGDRLVAIDGRECENLEISQVHSMLRGPAGTLVALEFRRNNPIGGGYPPVQAVNVTVARHAPRSQMPQVQRAAPPVERQEVRHYPATPRGVSTAGPMPVQRSPLQPTFHDPLPQREPVPAQAPIPSQGAVPMRPRVVRVTTEAGPDKARDISSALRMVADGGSVLVSGGVYEEEVQAHRPVYIKADDGANVEIRGAHGRPLLVSVADGVFVNGIKFDQGGGDAGRRGRQAVRCVEVARGHLTMSECTVRSDKGIALVVTDTAAAVVKRCMLHASGKCGLLAMDGGDVRLEHSAVQDNRMYGVVSQSGGKVALSECNVVRNKAVGVLVHRTAADCSIVGTEVTDNGEMGIAVQDGAQARAETSRILRNKHAGLYADGPSAWVSAFQCEFRESGVRGIGVQGGACVEALECQIMHNAHEGVFVSGGNSRSMLQGNEICNNGSKGVGVQSSGFVLLKGNKVRGNKEGGVFACDPNSLATVKDNAITHNGMRGIGVQLGATAEVESNVISENAAEGVYVSRKGSRALVVKNEISSNGVKGIGVQYGADASIESNEIFNNKLAGVHVDGQGSRATLRFNTMRGNPAAVVTEDGAVTRLVNNQLHEPEAGRTQAADLTELSSPRDRPQAATSNRPAAMPDAVEGQRMATPRQNEVAFKSLLTPRDAPTPRGQVSTPRPSAVSRPHPNNLMRTTPLPAEESRSDARPAADGGGPAAPRVRQNMRGRLQAFEDASSEQSPPNRPSAVPSLKIGNDFQGLHGGLNGGSALQTPRGRAPLRPEEEGDPSVKDWLMMPTYLNTPRTTRSTLDGEGSEPEEKRTPRDGVLQRQPAKVNREGIGGWALGDIGEWGEQVASFLSPRAGQTPRSSNGVTPR